MGFNPRLEDGPNKETVGYGMVQTDGFLYLLGGSSMGPGFLAPLQPQDFFFQNDLRSGKWTDLKAASSGVTGAPAGAREAHVFVAAKGDLYVHGGLVPGTLEGSGYCCAKCITTSVFNCKIPSAELHVYRPRQKKWERLTSEVYGEPPSARAGHSATVMNDLIYVYGGYGPDGGQKTEIRHGQGPVLVATFEWKADLFSFDPKTKRWTQHVGTQGGQPSPRNPLSDEWSMMNIRHPLGFAGLGSHLYLLMPDSFSRFDPTTGVWTTNISSLPPVEGLETARLLSMDGSLYALKANCSMGEWGVGSTCISVSTLALYRYYPERTETPWAAVTHGGEAPGYRFMYGLAHDDDEASLYVHGGVLGADTLQSVPGVGECSGCAFTNDFFRFSVGPVKRWTRLAPDHDPIDSTIGGFSPGEVQGDGVPSVAAGDYLYSRGQTRLSQLQGNTWVEINETYPCDCPEMFGSDDGGPYLLCRGDSQWYRLEASAWQEQHMPVQGLPADIQEGTLFYVDGELYLHAGDVEVYISKATLWENVVPANEIPVLSRRAVRRVGGSIFVHGGLVDGMTTETPEAVFYRLDIKRALWIELDADSGVQGVSPKRQRHYLMYFKEALYVVGGQLTTTIGEVDPFQRLPIMRFDLISLVWSEPNWEGVRWPEYADGHEPARDDWNELQLGSLRTTANGVYFTSSTQSLWYLQASATWKFFENGLTGLSEMYDGDVVLIEEHVPNRLDVSWSMNCVTDPIPCSLTLAGQGSSSRVDVFGGGIKCDSDSGCTEVLIQNVEFKCQTPSTQSLFEISGMTASLVMTKTTITGCSSEQDGGSISIWNRAALSMSACAINSSFSKSNGGAIAMSGAHVDLIDSKFYNCRSQGVGGALWAADLLVHPAKTGIGSVLTVRDCDFINNAADEGGALGLTGGSKAVVTACNFTNSTAGQGGGAAHISSADTEFVDCRFTANSAMAEGGAIQCISGSSVAITGSKVTENTAYGQRGGALQVDDAFLALEHNVFTQNRAPAGGGGVLRWQGLQQPVMVVPCPAGTYATADVESIVANCTACTAGKYSATVGAVSESECTSCAASKFSALPGATSADDCVPCSDSEFSAAGASECLQKCSAGTYFTAGDDPRCEPCPPGTYSEQHVGSSSSCTPCPAGTYQDDAPDKATTSVHCLSCGANKTSDSGSVGLGACRCRAGFASSTKDGHLKCTQCMGGTFWTPPTFSCSGPCVCETMTSNASFSGTFSDGPGPIEFENAGVDEAKTCSFLIEAPGANITFKFIEFELATGFADAFDTSSFIPSDTKIVTSFSPPLKGGISIIKNNNLAGEAQRTPEEIAAAILPFTQVYQIQAGYVTLVLTAQPSNLQVPGFQAQFRVDSGSGDTKCAPCRKGTYANSSQTGSCMLCPRGTYQDSLGSTACKRCDANRTTSDHGSEELQACVCKLGFKLTSDGLCTACAIGKYGSGQDECTGCPEGTFGNGTALTTCFHCPSGMSSPSSSSSDSVCTACEAGKYAAAGSPCTECPPGTYANLAGASFCLPCASGATSPPGSVSHVACTLCEKGKKITGMFQSCAGTLTFTDFGDGGAEQAAVCEDCAVDWYSDSLGGTTCTRCTPGKQTNGEAGSTSVDKCVVCPAGKFFDDNNRFCDTCKTGYYSLEGATVCTKCMTGAVSPSGSTTALACVACEAGKYVTVNDWGLTELECENCPVGKSSSAGAASAEECVATGSRAHRLPNGSPSPQAQTVTVRSRWATPAHARARHSTVDMGPGRRLLSLAYATHPRGAPLEEHAARLCALPGHGNTALFGDCTATDYTRLEIRGLPTPQAQGYAGVGLELEVLKKDAYGNTILSDTGSAVQIKTGLAGTYDVDDSTSLTGSIFSVLISGRTQFTNAIKPTFVKAADSDEVQTKRLPFIYVEGTDGNGANMRSNVLQAHLVSSSSMASICPSGYILSPDGTIDRVAGSPAVCTLCASNTYVLNPLSAEGCIACPKVRSWCFVQLRF